MLSSSMALCINNGGCICNTHSSQTHFSHRPQPLVPNNPSSVSSFSSSNSGRRSSHITGAKKFSSKTGRFDSKNKKIGGGISTTVEEKEEDMLERERNERDSAEGIDDGYFLPELPGDKPDFWEGSQWDGLGFFVQYQWAFGIVFALIACGVAVSTYNEGATDFKQTTVYKESVQSRELLEEPETSNSDVFEGNPTEEAPSLE